MRSGHDAPPRIPDGAIPPGRTRVLVALVAVYAADGRATVRAVSRAAGLNVSTAHTHLRRLRHDGLVTWEDDREATLRPLVAVVPLAPGPNRS